MTQYAVNLPDLLNHKNSPVMMLIKPVLGNVENAQTIQASKTHMDETAILMQCDAERAKAIINTVRIRVHKNYLRFYKKDRTAWKRI